MSEIPDTPEQPPMDAEQQQRGADGGLPAAKRSRVLKIFGAGLLLVMLVVGGIVWYASTASFEQVVRAKLISVLETATGGHVELQALRWNLFHLQVEADNLVIHGLESPTEVPYVSVSKLLVRARILAFLSPKVSLSLLEVTRPRFHLIVYPDGTTNQPTPRQKTHSSNKSISDTLLDLAVQKALIVDGVVLINEKKVLLDGAANDIEAHIGYIPSLFHRRDSYILNLSVADLTARRGKAVPVHSKLDLNAELGRNTAEIKSLKLDTGNGNVLNAWARLDDFRRPVWQVRASGTTDLREVEALAQIDGIQGGKVNLEVKAKGDAQHRILIDGDVSGSAVSYRTAYVKADGASFTAHLHADQEELDVQKIKARLAAGGNVEAELRLQNWLHTKQADESVTSGLAKSRRLNADVSKPMHGVVTASLADVPLRAALQLVAPPAYQNLGLDTRISGPGKVEWTGDAADIHAEAKLVLSPSRTRLAGQTPVTGFLDATYNGAIKTVQVRQLHAQMPSSIVDVQGSLGVLPHKTPSSLSVSLETRDLDDFNGLLTTTGLELNGRRGTAALPVSLNGEASFHGNISGSITDPKVGGHLQIAHFATLLEAGVSGTSSADTHGAQVKTIAQSEDATSGLSIKPAQTVIQWDNLAADVEYSSESLKIDRGILTRGSTVVHASGLLTAHQTGRRTFVYDENSAIDARLMLEQASLTEMIAISGKQLPLSGTVNLHLNVGGKLDSLTGGGSLSIRGGEIYGEKYKGLTADVNFSGQQVLVQNIVFQQDGGRLTGNASYNFQLSLMQAQLKGTDFELAHMSWIHAKRPDLDGRIDFDITANGPGKALQGTASIRLTGLSISGENFGDATVNAHTAGQTIVYDLSSKLVDQTGFSAHGETELKADYQTNAQLQFKQLNMARVMRVLNVTGVQTETDLDGLLKIDGPARLPRKLNGEVSLSQIAVNVQGVNLHSDGNVHATLRNGLLHLDPLHILGDATDIHANGEVGVVGSNTLNMHANGEIGGNLVHAINSDLTGAGQVKFVLDSSGTTVRPELKGKVQFIQVGVAMDGIPNGLSQMNGTLVFNQDRLEAKDLTAMTGGGQIKIEGYTSYRNGLYSDITATGKSIRVRYPQGVSTMADLKLHLQGGNSNMQLTGNVLITKFLLNPSMDMTAFSSNTVSTVPDPDALANRIRLDVHVTSAPQLNFQNSFAKLAGDVDLRIRGTIAQPSVLGRIAVTEGSAMFAGTQYQLQRGDIEFSNPVRIDPNIDLDATARVEDYDITLGLHGTSDKLNVTYRSEPPLSQADVIALLALGHTQEEQRIYNSRQSAAGVNPMTDALLSGALNATVSNRVQKLFGVGSVKIDPTFVGTLGNSTARVTVEQQVAKNVRLTYATNVNTTAQQFIQVEVDLTRTVSLLAVRDESQVFSLVFRIHRRFH